MAIELRGKAIVITGASSGIGAATAWACAAAGMRVVIAARRIEKLREVVERAGAMGVARGAIVPMACDVQDEGACARLIDDATREVGTLHAVFANAGYGQEASALEMPDAQLRAMLETNFWGSVWTIRPALRAMQERGSGHVLLCSSCVAKIGVPYLSAYTMSKAMQDHWARALRIELLGSGVHVSSVHPIGTRTEFFDVSASKSSTKAGLFQRTPKAFMQPPERVARAVVACLRRPKGEVWTSWVTRMALAASVAAPGGTDWLLGRKFGGKGESEKAAKR